MGLLLSCDRRIPDQVADLRQGTWNKGEYSKARGLHGRTLGIVGLGQIGREIAAARAQAFGMRVVAWSPEPDPRGGRPARHRLRADAARGGAARRRGDHQRGGQRRDEAPGERGVPRRRCGRARTSSTPRAARWWTRRRWRRRSREKKIRAGLDVFQSEPAGATRRVRQRRSCRRPASTARTTSARPPTRRRWRSRTR